MSSHLCCLVCVWSSGAGWVMTLAYHGVGPGCTAISAAIPCGGMRTAWAGVAIMGSPSFGVMAASPWTARRRWCCSAGSIQVSVGSMNQWRRMAWILGFISSRRSVPLWTSHSRGKFGYPLRSGVVRCCG